MLALKAVLEDSGVEKNVINDRDMQLEVRAVNVPINKQTLVIDRIACPNCMTLVNPLCE